MQADACAGAQAGLVREKCTCRFVEKEADTKAGREAEADNNLIDKCTGRLRV